MTKIRIYKCGFKECPWSKAMMVDTDNDFTLSLSTFDNLNREYLTHIHQKHNIPNYMRVETYDGV